ncbi:hypothetical protein [Haloferula sargassicola]|uniref:Uncharacterized protein n=1 Tax=Haloferula sargassicola TaxID=490096 RepID=A0ABP9URL6_9BACT
MSDLPDQFTLASLATSCEGQTPESRVRAALSIWRAAGEMIEKERPRPMVDYYSQQAAEIIRAATDSIPFASWLSSMMPGLKPQTRRARYLDFLFAKIEAGHAFAREYLRGFHSMPQENDDEKKLTEMDPIFHEEARQVVMPEQRGSAPRPVTLDPFNPPTETTKADPTFIWSMITTPYSSGVSIQEPRKATDQAKHLAQWLEEHGIPLTDAIRTETAKFLRWHAKSRKQARSENAKKAARARHSGDRK